MFTAHHSLILMASDVAVVGASWVFARSETLVCHLKEFFKVTHRVYLLCGFVVVVEGSDFLHKNILD